MSKHTPGPWHVVLSDNATPFIQHEHGADWTDIDDRSSRVCHMPAEIMENFNSMNNARLIAASPTLLEELQETHAALCFTHDYIGSIRYERNKAAIKLAGGEP